MTLGQFILGCVTLMVATIVYRWQRIVDRRLRLADEYRRHVVDYLEAAHEYYSLLHVKWGWGDHRKPPTESDLGELADRMAHLRACIELLASPEVVKAVDDYNSALGVVAWQMEMLDQDRTNEERSAKYLDAKNKVAAKRRALIDEMRREISDRPLVGFAAQSKQKVAE